MTKSARWLLEGIMSLKTKRMFQVIVIERALVSCLFSVLLSFLIAHGFRSFILLSALCALASSASLGALYWLLFFFLPDCVVLVH
jgi:hypothetical protein